VAGKGVTREMGELKDLLRGKRAGESGKRSEG